MTCQRWMGVQACVLASLFPQFQSNWNGLLFNKGEPPPQPQWENNECHWLCMSLHFVWHGTCFFSLHLGTFDCWFHVICTKNTLHYMFTLVQNHQGNSESFHQIHSAVKCQIFIISCIFMSNGKGNNELGANLSQWNQDDGLLYGFIKRNSFVHLCCLTRGGGQKKLCSAI